jgi:uncharacterized alkaline shock family protein YloU
MTEATHIQGKTTIAPEVLVSIAKLSALCVPGVYQMAPVPSQVSNFLKPRQTDGVDITVTGSLVTVDLYLIIQSDMNVREVAKAVQTKVARAIREMVGLEPGTITIHVEDIHYS